MTTMDLTINVDRSNGKTVQALASILVKWSVADFHVDPTYDGQQRPI